MFSRHDGPRRSPFTPYTALLALLWLLLVVYIITHPDPIGVIILIVMGVFIVGPTLFMWALIVRRQRLAQSGADDEYASPAGQNGHYIAGANGAHAEPPQGSDEISGEIPGEIPDEGGENP